MRTAILIILAAAASLQVQAQDSIPDSATQQLVTYYKPYSDSIQEQNNAIFGDTIVSNSGESIICRITEVSPEVIYFVVDTLPDVTCLITTSSVFMIKYSNGTRDLGSNLLTPDYYAMGLEDGHTYYKSREAFAGTFASGAVCWFMGLGLISGIAITATPPKKIHNAENVNDHLLNTNQDYYDGYMKSAKKKKVLHSTLGFFAGVGTFTAVVVIIIVSQF